VLFLRITFALNVDKTGATNSEEWNCRSFKVFFQLELQFFHVNWAG